MKTYNPDIKTNRFESKGSYTIDLVGQRSLLRRTRNVKDHVDLQEAVESSILASINHSESVTNTTGQSTEMQTSHYNIVLLARRPRHYIFGRVHCIHRPGSVLRAVQEIIIVSCIMKVKLCKPLARVQVHMRTYMCNGRVYVILGGKDGISPKKLKKGSSLAAVHRLAVFKVR